LYQSQGATPSLACSAAAGVSTPFSPAAPTLAGFSVIVKCVSSADANAGVTMKELTSTACNQPGGACPGGSADYVERVVQAVFKAPAGGPVIYRRELH
jgi:hypothetical protein